MNKLDNLTEFQDILATYKVSETSKQVLANTRLMLMVAPSASGRNTIIGELLRTGQYHFIISDTTRKPRINDGVQERDGVEYWFRTEDEVLTDLKNGKFLEAEILHNQHVSGISIRELERAKDENRIAVTDIDLQGIHNVIQAKPDTISLLILPPTFDEWQHRLNNRGQMDPAELVRRLQTAVRILKDSLTHDYFTFVVNDEFHHSVKKIQDIVKHGRNQIDQEYGQEVIYQVMQATEKWLEQHN